MTPSKIKKEAREEGRLRERQRIKAIIESKHAPGRKALAYHLALKTETPEIEAISILEKAPIDSDKATLPPPCH